MTTTISVTGSNNDTALVLDSNYGNIATTPNDKAESNLNNLGIFSKGDLPSLIKGPWNVYKMPAPGYPNNVAYRYISKNGDKLLCWGQFQSVLSTLSTNELENKEGLITSLSFYNNGGPLCGSIINSTHDTSLYYQNFNSSPFVFATEELPFIANLSEVEFKFDNEGNGIGSETFTEIVTIKSCTNKETNKVFTITELQSVFGPDAKYLDMFPAFQGTLVNTFSITQDDIDSIPGTFTPLPPKSKYWDSTTMSYLETNTPSVAQTDTDVLLKDLLGLTDVTTVDKTPNTAVYPATQTDYLNYYYWQLNDPSRNTLATLQTDLSNIQSKLKTEFPFEGIESSRIKYGIFNYSVTSGIGDASNTNVFSATLIYVSRTSLGVSFENFVTNHINTTALGTQMFSVKNKTDIILGTTQGPRGGSANLHTVKYSEFNENDSFLMVPRIFNFVVPKSSDKKIIKEAIDQHIMWANLTHNWYDQAIYKAKGLSVRPTAIIDFFDVLAEITINNTEYLFFSLVELYTGAQGLVGHIAMANYGLNEFSKKWAFDKNIELEEFGFTDFSKFSIPKPFALVSLSLNNDLGIVDTLSTEIGSLIVNQEIIQQYNYDVSQSFVDDWTTYYTDVIKKYYSIHPVYDATIPGDSSSNDWPVVGKAIPNKVLFWLSTYDNSELSTPSILDDIIGPNNLTKDNLYSKGYITML